MIKKINMIICTIIFFFIIYSVIDTVGNIFKNNLICYLIDIFIAYEVYWFIQDLLNETDQNKKTHN